MKFRNYLPHDKQLQEGKVAPPVLPKFEDPIATLPPVEEKKEVLPCLHYFFSFVVFFMVFTFILVEGYMLCFYLVKFQDPFLNIAPKKPNWDLRRDVQKKLDKLEKRTMKALSQLMGTLFPFSV